MINFLLTRRSLLTLAGLMGAALPGPTAVAADLAAVPTNYRMIRGPAGDLRVDDGGTGGIPVVFVHAYGGTLEHWAAQLAYVRSVRRAIALDLRGHGRSDAPDDREYAVNSLARDVAAVADELALESFVLVGHSLGGAVAIAYAGQHPERVAGLLLVGTPGRMPRAEAEKTLAALAADYATVSRAYWDKLLTGARPEVARQVRNTMESVPREDALQLIRATFDFDPVPVLSAFPAPVFVIVTSPVDAPHDLHVLLPNLPHERIKDASHWPQLDEPAAFNQLLDAFLKRVEERG